MSLSNELLTHLSSPRGPCETTPDSFFHSFSSPLCLMHKLTCQQQEVSKGPQQLRRANVTQEQESFDQMTQSFSQSWAWVCFINWPDRHSNRTAGMKVVTEESADAKC